MLIYKMQRKLYNTYHLQQTSIGYRMLRHHKSLVFPSETKVYYDILKPIQPYPGVSIYF
jgi:hypothetical protein